MKVVQINASCDRGSTGKIIVSISRLLHEKGIENYILFSSGRANHANEISCCSFLYTKFQALKSHVLGNYGFNSIQETKRIIRHLERIHPDIVHLHNIHGHDCHLGMLFTYFKRKKIKLYWTFHDCWAFTAYCPYYSIANCHQWKEECTACPRRKAFSFFVDRSRELFNKKKELFRGLDLSIITPSQWLADQVRQSFLKTYPIQVIHNGIDLDVFKPTYGTFREQYQIPVSRQILLGVAYGWGDRKGLDVFVELARRLDPDKYQLVLVGTNEKTDSWLPEHVLSIRRTYDQRELAEIYTAADLFINPTREEVLGMVNIEALACGTPVLTFRTGGGPECLDNTCGCVVDYDDVDALEQAVHRICEEKPFTSEDCMRKAREFDMYQRYEEYIRLYRY